MYTSEVNEETLNLEQLELESKFHNYSVASLVLGIISLVFMLFGAVAIVSVICGTVGLVLSSKVKNEMLENFEDINYSKIEDINRSKAGFVCSLIGLILGGITLFIVFVVIGVIASVAI